MRLSNSIMARTHASFSERGLFAFWMMWFTSRAMSTGLASVIVWMYASVELNLLQLDGGQLGVVFHVQDAAGVDGEIPRAPAGL